MIVRWLCWSVAVLSLASSLEAQAITPRVAAGGDHTVGLDCNGAVATWGFNHRGQLGDGTNHDSYVPVDGNGLSHVVAIAGGNEHTVALREDGTVWAWGGNSNGQLGVGTEGDSTRPVRALGMTGVQAVAAGAHHTIALKRDGTVWAWGANDLGQLGNGSTTFESLVPVRVSGLTGVVAIDAGVWHTAALKTDGTVWTWGYNDAGQLGDGSRTNSSIPVQVVGLNGVVAIGLGANHTFALKADGSVWAWGSNSWGELGIGSDVIQSSVPVQVRDLTDVVAVAGGGSHTVARKRDGTLWTWGSNLYGQLGDGTNNPSSVPVMVPGLGHAVAVAAGHNHTLTLKENGSVWAWGFNFHGQLGNGNNIDSARPEQVAGQFGNGLLNLCPTSVPFITFAPVITIAPDHLEANASFQTGRTSNGINPPTETLTLELNAFSLTIPANSFHRIHGGHYVFDGVVDGMRVAARLIPRVTGGYRLVLQARDVDLTGLNNPVKVTLTIGDDTGTKEANAIFK